MEPVLVASHLTKRFGNGVVAVDDVSITLHRGQTVGIVGESGCGKSTTGKLILQLLRPDTGSVTFEGADLTTLKPAQLRAARAKLQLVPQNPQTSLNPRLTVGSSVAFNLRAHVRSRSDRQRRVGELLDQVGIPADLIGKYPHELSGGQLQRVAIARALSTDPSVIVCDEAVSALDKSIQAQVLNLLADLQKERGIAYLFISHDLGTVEHMSDRVYVMYLGRIVEQADASDLWERSVHPYSEALLSATPGRSGQRIVLWGELPSPTDPPSGCGFRTRCPIAIDECASDRPPLVELDPSHGAACILAGQRWDPSPALTSASSI